MSVICDDTDVFALLLHVVAEMKPNGLLCMCSTVKDRAVIDIMQSVKVHIHLLARTARLSLHAIGDTKADEAIVLESKLRPSYWLAMAKVSADVPAFVKPGSKCED